MLLVVELILSLELLIPVVILHPYQVMSGPSVDIVSASIVSASIDNIEVQPFWQRNLITLQWNQYCNQL